MSTPSDLLNSGAEAVQQKRYAEAIALLELYCQGAVDRRSKPFFQAQMWLIRAYTETDQADHGIAICQQLAKSDIAQVRQWAEKTLPKLEAKVARSAPAEAVAAPEVPEPKVADSPSFSPPPSGTDADFFQQLGRSEPLTAAAASELFSDGMKAFRRGDYAPAIDSFEQFLRGTDPGYSNYAWAQTNLAKAYHGNQQDEAAVSLCRTLVESDRESTRTWAQDFLEKTLNIDIHADRRAPGGRNADQSLEAPSENPPRDKFGQTSAASSRQNRTVSPTRSSSSGPADLTSQLQSGMAHGSISLFFNLLVVLLFRDSIVANLLIMARFAVPIVIFIKAEDEVAKANAREALNYLITIVIYATLGIFIILGLMGILIAAGPLAILIMLVIGVYALMLAIMPLVATVITFKQEGRVFRYPGWLILHLL
jgi:uncharacterized Tic20 family protein